MPEPVLQLGSDFATGRPVTIPVKLLERHCWIQGMTGARKTIIVTKILVQLMEQIPEAVFVLCDLGGDQYAFHRSRETALKVGKSFQFLSVNKDDDWDSLDPMAAITPLTDLSMAASYLQSIFGGDHGEGYGPGFFSRYSYVTILRLLMSFVAEGVYSPTLHDFAKRFAGGRGKLSDQSEAQLAAEMMLTYEQVQPSEWGHKRIDVREVFEKSGVTYGFFPTLMHPGARMLATTLVFSFVLEAMRRHYAGLPQRPVYLCIDEFPSIAGSKQWADLLTLCRKYSIHILILAQSGEQMKSRDRDLLPVLFDNTAVKIWLTPISLEDIDTLRALSKDRLKQRGTTQGFRAGVSSISLQEVFEPILESNDIRDAAYSGDQGYLIVNAWQGHVEPVRFRFTPDVSQSEYDRLATLPLPKRDPSVPLPQSGEDSAVADRQAMLDALWRAKQQQFRWEEEG